MRGLGLLKELAERKLEPKQERELVEKKAEELNAQISGDEKSCMRLAYANFLCRMPLEKNRILYESFGGRGMICNPYAIFKYLMSDKKYQKYEHIWVIEDFEDNAVQMEEYKDCPNVQFVKYMSEDYLLCLATAKYLINNVSFPGFFVKRKGQVYLNTWHGIPMKTMGFDIPGGNVSSGNSARNLLNADYLISASPYMTEKAYLESYKMKGLYEGTILENGFPRNDVFFHSDRKEIIGKLNKCGVNVDPDKKIILYAPTWKGEKYSRPETSLEEYYKFIETVERAVDTTKYQVLVKPHQIVYYHIRNNGKVAGQFIPATLDTNEILSVVDVLVSDYSSIHFDFLVSGKPLVFFVPDFNEFTDYRGLYFGLDKLPGPVIKTYEELENTFRKIEETAELYTDKYREEKSWACPRDDGNVCMRVAETLFGGKNSGAEVRCADTEKKKLLVYGGDFEDNDITAVFLSYLNNIIDYDKFDVTVLAQSETGSADERINSVLDAVRVLYWKPFYEATLEEFARHLLMEKRDPESKMCPPYEFYRRELTRAAGDSKFDYAVSFADSSAIFNRISAYSKDMKKIDVKEAKLKNSVDVKGIEEELQNQTILDDGGNRYYIAGIKNCGEGILEAKTIELPSKDRLNVVTLGRFLRENHYEKLIKEFDLICRERQDAHLYFIGDGEVREKIEKLVADRHLTDKITLLGEVDHPLNFIKQCDCFALENALGEQSPDILKVRALGIPAVWKYSEIRSVLKGSRKQEKLDVDAYNSVVRREFESLFEV